MKKMSFEVAIPAARKNLAEVHFSMLENGLDFEVSGYAMFLERSPSPT